MFIGLMRVMAPRAAVEFRPEPDERGGEKILHVEDDIENGLWRLRTTTPEIIEHEHDIGYGKRQVPNNLEYVVTYGFGPLQEPGDLITRITGGAISLSGVTTTYAQPTYAVGRPLESAAMLKAM